MTITGVPSTRVSDQFIRQRMLQQVQFDQSELFRLQTQLSTGYRFNRPGEDPISAGRIMSLQSLLERKEQVRTNLTTNQSFLTSTDVALSRVSGMVADVRGAAMSVIGTAASEEQRSAAAMQVNEAVKQLLDSGNQNFRGRYLFAGSTTLTRPFQELGNGVIEYLGNETRLLSYSDVDLLFETNVDGSYVFGAISEPVRGEIDLNPALNFNTRLADLRGGLGISSGSIAISDGSNTSIVDITGANTIGDVAALIRENPPEGSLLHVEVTATGLRIELTHSTAGDLSIREVGHGTTAGELGIFTGMGVGLTPVEGEDLDPILRTTSKLDDLLGSRARAVVATQGENNDFILTANRNGADLNGVTVHFVDDTTVSYGNETVTYDGVAGRIEIAIDAGLTQTQHVVAAVNAAFEADTIPFEAQLDSLDQGMYPGSGLVFETPVGEAAATTAYGSGIDFDRDSGLQIENGGQTHTVRFDTAETVEDLLNALNGSGAGVTAAINDAQDGIDVRSRLSGADFGIGENGGTTASELGLRTFSAETRLDDMNHGFGVMDAEDVGVRAAVSLGSTTNSRLALQARDSGPEWNDYRVEIVDAGSVVGSEYASWDQATRTITIGVVPGVTTANDVVEVFNNSDGPRDHFEISLDAPGGAVNSGEGVVHPSAGTTTGGRSGGADFVITRRDGTQLEIDLAGLETIEDVLTAINSHSANIDRLLSARLATHGNGIELVDESLGEENLQVARTALSTAAIDLGLIPVDGESADAQVEGTRATVAVSTTGLNNDLVFRANFPGSFANGYQVVFEDTGTESFTFDQVSKVLRFQIDGNPIGGTTAQDIIDLLADDATASALFSATLDTAEANDGSGVVAATAAPMELAGGEPAMLTGRDTSPTETKGIFTALLRLERALIDNDLPQIQRSIELIESSVLQLNFARAELGAKQQGLDILSQRLDAEELDLREVLSEEHDVDIVEVISQMTARQMALEASMQATAQMVQMTLLNYL